MAEKISIMIMISTCALWLWLWLIGKGLTQPIYQLSQICESENGYVGQIDLISGQGPFGDDIKHLKLFVFFETEMRLHIKIIDAHNERWEVYPNDVIYNPFTPKKAPSKVNYNITFEKLPFSMKVTRIFDGEVIFKSTDDFVFSNYYISFGTKLIHQASLYGFGQRHGAFKLNDTGTYTMWAKDNYKTYEKNLYSSHPFYIERRKENIHGMFLYNSNAIDAIIYNNTLQMKIVGGIIDVYFFIGNEKSFPLNIIREYHKLLGYSYLPPKWALGFHQCRYGYKNIDDVINVVKKYEKYEIPLDGMWMDIDHMDNYKDFTFDPIDFPLEKVNLFMALLKSLNKHGIVILDPFISIEYTDYKPLELGLKMNVFIRNNSNNLLISSAWPGKVLYPDWTHPNSSMYIEELIRDFLKLAPMSGYWLDMQDPSAFCHCECPNEEHHVNHENLQKKKKKNFNIPYTPGGVDLEDITLCLDAKHYDTIHLNVHNLYAHFENLRVHWALQNITKKRSFTLVRSTFPGSGRFTSHWLGDNQSHFKDLKYSIAMIFEAGFNSIIHSGADICGFIGNTTKELCSRWMALGTFYPFARNHNDKHSISQEPWALGLIDLFRKFISIRMNLLQYFYTELEEINRQGGMFWRPLFFDFIQDENTWHIDEQVLIGKSLLISPALHEGQENVNVYLPSNEIWYDYYTYIKMKGGSYYKYNAPWDCIPVHIRGGRILPIQESALSTYLMHDKPFTLIICLNENGNAFGELYFDDGVSIDRSIHTYVQMECKEDNKKGNCISNLIQKSYNVNSIIISEMKIFGINLKVEKVWVNFMEHSDFKFDQTSGLLVRNLKVRMSDAFDVMWS